MVCSRLRWLAGRPGGWWGWGGRGSPRYGGSKVRGAGDAAATVFSLQHYTAGDQSGNLIIIRTTHH